MLAQPAFGTVAPTSRRAVAYIIDAAISGGEVLVSSEEGQGSTFVLRLPVSMMVTSDEGVRE